MSNHKIRNAFDQHDDIDDYSEYIQDIRIMLKEKTNQISKEQSIQFKSLYLPHSKLLFSD